MYYQVYIYKPNMKQAQHSCDSFTEVQELLEEKKPKFVRVEYFDQDGLVGIAKRMFSLIDQTYQRYGKIFNARP